MCITFGYQSSTPVRAQNELLGTGRLVVKFIAANQPGRCQLVVRTLAGGLVKGDRSSALVRKRTNLRV